MRLICQGGHCRCRYGCHVVVPLECELLPAPQLLAIIRGYGNYKAASILLGPVCLLPLLLLQWLLLMPVMMLCHCRRRKMPFLIDTRN